MGLRLFGLHRLRHLLLHFIELRNARTFFLDQHRNRKAVLDAGALADVIGIVQGRDGFFELLRAADVGHIITRFHERRLAHHVGGRHVGLCRELLGDLLQILGFFQPILGALSDFLRYRITTTIAQRDQQLRLGILETLRH